MYLFLERREGKEKGEEHQCVVASRMPLSGGLTCNPGMFPDWESNLYPLVHRPMLNSLSYISQGVICFKMRLYHHRNFPDPKSHTSCF